MSYYCELKIYFEYLTNQSSCGGLGVERWSALVDQIQLGETIPAMSMFYVHLCPFVVQVTHTQ